MMCKKSSLETQQTSTLQRDFEAHFGVRSLPVNRHSEKFCHKHKNAHVKISVLVPTIIFTMTYDIEIYVWFLCNQT